MKRLFFALTFSAVGFFNHASAITPSALEAFRNSYIHAKEVHWSAIDKGYKVSFKLDAQYITAYYTADGNLIGTTRNISLSELSPKLRTNLSKELNQAWISDLFVLNTEEGSVYFATVESATTKLVLKSKNGRRWEPYKSQDK